MNYKTTAAISWGASPPPPTVVRGTSPPVTVCYGIARGHFTANYVPLRFLTVCCHSILFSLRFLTVPYPFLRFFALWVYGCLTLLYGLLLSFTVWYASSLFCLRSFTILYGLSRIMLFRLFVYLRSFTVSYVLSRTLY
jgi:hypothetical protein